MHQIPKMCYLLGKNVAFNGLPLLGFNSIFLQNTITWLPTRPSGTWVWKNVAHFLYLLSLRKVPVFGMSALNMTRCVGNLEVSE